MDQSLQFGALIMASIGLKSVGTLGGMSPSFAGAYEVTFTVDTGSVKGDLVVSVPIAGEIDNDVVSKARELLKAALISLADVALKPEPAVVKARIPF